MKIAVYPGSFDPITLGHLNIIKRASRIFDKVYVCLMINSAKKPTFTLEERFDFLTRATKRFENVEVDHSEGLLIDYARSKGASVIVKGLRAVSDFDMEFQIALFNKRLEPMIDTMFLTADEKYTFLSSTIVREMARYNADLSKFVPREIIDDVLKKLQNGG